MAGSTRSFNLLYKVEAQKTFIDKLYDFLVGPTRLILSIVMILIIGVFAYRFFLDAQLRDAKKLNDEYVQDLNLFVIPNEQTYRDIMLRTEIYSKYIERYNTDTQNPVSGKLHSTGDLYLQINNIKAAKYPTSITIAQFNYSTNSNTPVIQISGAASTFITVDQFANDIKSLPEVLDASSTNLGSTREDLPRYQIDIKLK
jgi:hypothetical protein